jgi:hypothetical protein
MRKLIVSEFVTVEVRPEAQDRWNPAVRRRLAGRSWLALRCRRRPAEPSMVPATLDGHRPS